MKGFGFNGSLGSFSLTDFIKKATDTYNANASILDPLRNSAVQNVLSPGGSSTTPGNTGINPGATINQTLPGGSSPMSTGVKVALGLGVAGVVGGIIYVVTKKKKGLSGGSSGVADDNKATSTVFNGFKKSKKRKK